MGEFLVKLFDTQDFPARWHCGTWTDFHGWLHIVSDIAVFLAYTLIPCVIFYFACRRKDIQFPRVFWLFAAFIFACGTVHLIEATIFFNPIYRVAAVFKFGTAVISWATLIALIVVTPKALSLPSIASLYRQLESEAETLRETKFQLSQALNELQLSKELTDAIIESVGTGVIVADSDGKIILENHAARQITGRSIKDIDQSALSKAYGIYHPDCSTPVEEHELPLIRALNGETVSGEELALIKDSIEDTRFVHVNATPVRNRNGQQLGAVVAFDDISTIHEQRSELKEKQRETQTELFQANKRLGGVLNSISDVIWSAKVVDGEISFVYFSPRVRTLTGYPADHFLGGIDGFLSIVFENDRAFVANIFSSIKNGVHGSIQEEYRISNESNVTLWTRNRMYVEPDTADEETRIYGVMSDITRERRTRDALIQAERLSSLGTLSAGVAHEINNPLGSMLLTTELAITQLQNGQTETKVTSTLNRIICQIERCSKIVGNVLQFAKNEESEKLPASIVEIAQRARDMIASKALSRNTMIVFDNQSNDTVARVSETEIEQVLINLFSNAIEAAPEESEVLLKIADVAENKELQISVHDAGPGMDDTTKKRAFDPFFTCRRDSGGTGLGLSMCHSIVARHGGQIKIGESEEKGGAKVQFTIPKLSSETASDARPH